MMSASGSGDGPELARASVLAPWRRPLWASGVAMTDLGEQYVVLEPTTGELYSARSDVAAIWPLLDGSTSLQQLATELADVEGSAPAQALDRLEALLRPLVRSELIVMADEQQVEERSVYAALDHRFRLTCDHVALNRALREVLAPLAQEPSNEPATTYTIRITEDAGTAARYELFRDGDLLVASGSKRALPAARLLQEINHAVARSDAETVRLHAAAASDHRGTLVLPAAQEHGKSTLVAALVSRGWRYVSDEVVAVEVADPRRVRAFPRSISLDRGSWPLLPALEPTVETAARPYLPSQWQVPVHRIGTVEDDPPPLTALVFPRLADDPDGTSASRLAPFEVLRRLLGCCFTVEGTPSSNLRTLSNVAQTIPAYELPVDNLDTAVRAINDVLEDAVVAQAGPAQV